MEWLNWGQPTPEEVLKKEIRTLSRAKIRLGREEAAVEREIDQHLKEVKEFDMRHQPDRRDRSALLVHRKRNQRKRLWSQQDNIAQLVDRVREQHSKAKTDTSLTMILRVMAARNGTVTPKAYRRMMQMHERAKIGQELRNEMLEEVCGEDEFENPEDDTDDEKSDARAEIIASVLQECEVGSSTSTTSMATIMVQQQDTDTSDLDKRLQELKRH